MTVELAENILQQMDPDVKVAFRHRFGGETGTILRLDNYAMINIFDDGRYYIQGDNTDELVIAFGLIEAAWDPDSWSPLLSGPPVAAEPVLPWKRPPEQPPKRFEF